jgi:Ni,Fe-hydrogenase I large subunit
MDALSGWADAGQTGAARFIASVRDESAAATVPGGAAATAVPLLASHDHAQWLPGIARAADADAEFARAPTLNDQPAETGALARLQAEPLVSALAAAGGQRVLARFVARLRELALLLTGQGPPVIGTIALPGGIGVGWVETARGLLIHQTRWQQGRTERYRIIAPTEWNFHPQGALARALTGAAAAGPARLQQAATRLVQSLDPCVVFRLELHGA